jgi:16S rRNA (uracil1498-N3)-methyltransferase
VRRIRLYVPDLRSGSLVIQGDEHTHLARVLRLKAGAKVQLFDGEGGSARGELSAVERRRSQVEVGAIETAPERGWRLAALVATPKSKRARRLVEALTELGVDEITPLVTARSEARPPRPEELRRWAVEACKQCWRDRLPSFGEPTTPAAVAERVAAGELGLLPDTLEAQPLKGALPETPQDLLFVIGPEGGFNEAERELLGASLRAISLGPTVLRIETAAQALVGAIGALWA